MTTHTRESRYIRDKNQRRVPQEDWFIYENMHEAIIPPEKWELANSMIRHKASPKRNTASQSDSVFYCAHCHRKLQKSFGQEKYFYCESAKFHSDSPCGQIKLNRTAVEETMAAALRVQLCLLENQRSSAPQKRASDSMACYQLLQQTEHQLTTLQSKKLERYEAYRNGEISREQFIAIKERLSKLVDELSEKKTQLEDQYQRLLLEQQSKHDESENVENVIQILSDYDAGIKTHLYNAISRLIVSDNEHIEIEWTFPDLFSTCP